MTRVERIHQRLESAGMGNVALGDPPGAEQRYPRVLYTYTPDSRRRRWVLALGAGMGERVWTTLEVEAALDLLEAWRNRTVTTTGWENRR